MLFPSSSLDNPKLNLLMMSVNLAFLLIPFLSFTMQAQGRLLASLVIVILQVLLRYLHGYPPQCQCPWRWKRRAFGPSGWPAWGLDAGQRTLDAGPRTLDAWPRAWCLAAREWCQAALAWCRAARAWCRAVPAWYRAAHAWCLAPPHAWCRAATLDAGARALDAWPLTLDAGPRALDAGPRALDVGPNTHLGPRAFDAGLRALASDAGSRALDGGPRLLADWLCARDGETIALDAGPRARCRAARAGCPGSLGACSDGESSDLCSTYEGTSTRVAQPSPLINCQWQCRT